MYTFQSFIIRNKSSKASEKKCLKEVTARIFSDFEDGKLGLSGKQQIRNSKNNPRAI